MENLGIGAGLAALAFWGFVATAVVAGVWDNIRKREAQHETMRRIFESGQPLDHETMEMLSLASGNEPRHDQAFKITALWVLPIAPAVAVFALILGTQAPEAEAPLLGVAALLAIMGTGFFVASKIVAPWYAKDSDQT